MENDDQMGFMVEGEDRDTSLELSLFNGSQFASIWEHWPTPISTEECGSSLLLSEFSNFPPVNNFKSSQESSNFCEDQSASSWEEPVQYSSYPLEHSLFPEKGISELKPGSPASPLSLCNIEYIPHTQFSRHASFDGMYQASPYMHFPIHVGDDFSQSIPHGADPCFLRSLSDPTMYDPSLFMHNRMLSVKDHCGLPAFHKSNPSAKLALKSLDREKSSPERSISSTGSIKQGNLLSQSGRETTPPKRMMHPEEDSSAKRLCLEDKRWTDTNADRNADVKPSISTVTSSGGEPSNELTVIGPALNTNGKPRAKRGSATDPQSVYARHRRERISERLKMLQSLVPNGAKVDIVTMLEEAINYVKFLQLQVKLLSSDEYWMYAPTTYNGINVTFGIHIGMQQAS